MHIERAINHMSAIVFAYGVFSAAGPTKARFVFPTLRVPRPTAGALIGLLCLSLLIPAPILGKTPGDDATLDALVQLETAIQRERGLSPETKLALHALVVALRNERMSAAPIRADAPSAPFIPEKNDETPSVVEELIETPAPQEAPRWEGVLRRLKVYGDMRLRAESNVNLVGKPARHRQRVRLRMGATYDLSDEVQLGTRLTTGNPADPQSPHATFGNVLHDLDVSFDRVFMTYRPNWLNGTSFTAGKFSHPFYRNPIYGELVWDADVQPEGFVIGYSWSGDGHLKNFGFAAGQYLLLEQERGSEGTASVFQVSSSVQLADDLQSNFALGYSFYSDVAPSGSTKILAENGGNATVDLDADGTPDAFVSQFAILNPVVGFTYDWGELPLTVSAEYILNTRARIEQNQGWATGASLGKTQKKGDWRLYYQWQVIQQDAVFTPFAQDDFLFFTNHRSHVFGLNNQLTNKIGLNIWSLVSTQDDPTTIGVATDENQWRLRFDLNFKF